MTKDTLNINNYLKQAINSFKYDPPDSDFQRGYLAALEELERVNNDRMSSKIRG